MSRTPSIDRLRHAVAEECFAAADPAARRLGAEFEWIPVDSATRRVAPIDDGAGGGTLPLLRHAAERDDWSEGTTAKGAPVFMLKAGGTVTYEPGGQIEYGTPALDHPSLVASRLHHVGRLLTEAAAERGITLLTVGLDPENAPAEAPLLLESPRYRRMAGHFAHAGHAGARMMRQTAAIQLAVDLGGQDVAGRRWRVLNAAAPLLTAIFANSPVCEGQPAGEPSHRAAIWRLLDGTRTGLPWDGTDPVGRYLEFALDADAFLLGDADATARPFRQWWQDGAAGLGDFHVHLSTLFPEVRPRGYFEVRGIDSLPLAWAAVPMTVVATLAYEETATQEVLALLGSPDPDLLLAASAHGLGDRRVAGLSRDLMAIVCERARRLADLEAAALAEQVEGYADRYTRQARAPADDVLESLSPLGRT